jgi:hypothetical protein
MRTKDKLKQTTAPDNRPAPPDQIPYEEAVRQGKEIMANISGKQWELGDLAATVTKDYGQNRLEQFAQDINFHGEYSTLERYRDVCKAWPKSRGRPRFFASAQILATHEGRWEIVERNPDISKSEARELMRKRYAEQGTPPVEDNEIDRGDEDTNAAPPSTQETPAPDNATPPSTQTNVTPTPTQTNVTPTPTQTQTNVTPTPSSAKTDNSTPPRGQWSKDRRRFFSEGRAAFNTVIGMKNTAQQCIGEQKRELMADMDQDFLMKLEQTEEACVFLRKWLHEAKASLEKRLGKEANELLKTNRIRTTPAPVQH